MKDTTNVQRRTFLSGLGLGALGPFVPLLEVEAAGPDPIKRLILFFNAFGTTFDVYYQSSPRWRPSGSETNFAFTGSVSAPLEPHKKDLVVLDGMQVQRVKPIEEQHESIATLWTGSALAPDGGGWGGGISVDQYVANKLGVKTLELGVDVPSNNLRSRMSYAGSNRPLTPHVDPRGAFDALFASSVATEPAALVRLRAERKSVLDLAHRQLGRLQPKVSAHDRYKIDAHLTAVSELEKKLQQSSGADGMCTTAPRPPVFSLDSKHFMEIASAQVDLMVLAMACDLVRIGSIQLKDEDGNYIEWTGTQSDFHSLSHEDAPQSPAMDRAYHDFHVVFAQLVQKLKSTPGPTGGTLLDGTLVAWGCCTANGHHRWHPVPFILAGNAGGAFTTGRFLTYDQPMDHYRLLVSICHAMGVPAMSGEKFGNMDGGSGPLPKL